MKYLKLYENFLNENHLDNHMLEALVNPDNSIREIACMQLQHYDLSDKKLYYAILPVAEAINSFEKGRGRMYKYTIELRECMGNGGVSTLQKRSGMRGWATTERYAHEIINDIFQEYFYTNGISIGFCDELLSDDFGRRISWDDIKHACIENGRLIYKFVNFPFDNLSFDARDKIVTLQGCPEIIDGKFTLDSTNQLKSLQGAPYQVKECIINNCEHLTTLEGGPSIVTSVYEISKTNIVSLKGIASDMDWLSISNTKLTNLKYFPHTVREQIRLTYNPLLSDYSDICSPFTGELITIVDSCKNSTCTPEFLKERCKIESDVLSYYKK